MITGFIRAGAGILMMLVFLVLLLILVSKRSIREEPRGVLVIIMTLLGFAVPGTLFTVATADVVTGEATPLTFCCGVMSLAVGVAIAFKMSALFLAVDQYVAVVHCLHYYTIMEHWIQRMVGMICGCILFCVIFGLACFHLGLENTAEFHQRMFGVQRNLTRCSWEQLAGVYVLFGEIFLLVLAIATCALALYTAVVGLKYEKSITQQQVTPETRRFVTSFKSFKQIVKVLLVLLALDILSGVVRIASRWYPPSTVINLVQLPRLVGVIIECWTYGLGHATVRAHLRKHLCRRRGNSPAELPPIQQPADLSPIERSAGIASAERQEEMPSVQRPEELPPVDRPAEPPLSQRPAELPPTERPDEMPSVQRPEELAPVDRPAEVPPVEPPLIQRPAELPPTEGQEELPPVERLEELSPIRPAWYTFSMGFPRGPVLSVRLGILNCVWSPNASRLLYDGGHVDEDGKRLPIFFSHQHDHNERERHQGKMAELLRLMSALKEHRNTEVMFRGETRRRCGPDGDHRHTVEAHTGGDPRSEGS